MPTRFLRCTFFIKSWLEIDCSVFKAFMFVHIQTCDIFYSFVISVMKSNMIRCVSQNSKITLQKCYIFMISPCFMLHAEGWFSVLKYTLTFSDKIVFVFYVLLPLPWQILDKSLKFMHILSKYLSAQNGYNFLKFWQNSFVFPPIAWLEWEKNEFYLIKSNFSWKKKHEAIL